jgi:hypothetical protein
MTFGMAFGGAFYTPLLHFAVILFSSLLPPKIKTNTIFERVGAFALFNFLCHF